jgi:hypothetical protein
MCSASHRTDVQMMVQLIPVFVKSVPNNGSFGSCASFLLEFLVPGVNGYLAFWFHMKLYVKYMLHSCYGLVLH